MSGFVRPRSRAKSALTRTEKCAARTIIARSYTIWCHTCIYVNRVRHVMSIVITRKITHACCNDRVYRVRRTRRLTVSWIIENRFLSSSFVRTNSNRIVKIQRKFFRFVRDAQWNTTTAVRRCYRQHIVRFNDNEWYSYSTIVFIHDIFELHMFLFGNIDSHYCLFVR